MTGYAENALIGGMRFLAESQAAIAHNLANVNSTGFRRRLPVPVQSDGFAQMLRRRLPTVDYGEQTDWTPGTSVTTGDKLHMALEGRGFFMVENAAGEHLYTRNGAMSLDADGYAVNASGHHFLDPAGQRIRIDVRGTDAAANLQIQRDGSITLGDVDAGRIGVFDVDDPQRLVPAGASLYRDTGEGAGGRPTPVRAPFVRQGHLEHSNVDTLTELVQMLGVQRSFQASQRALSTMGRLETTFLNAIAR